ncbi:MAG: hypothetical protein ACOYON_07925 [Fimbriimonas sp.]
MASKRTLLGLSLVLGLGAIGCGTQVVKAGVPPPEKQTQDQTRNLPPDRAGTRGGLGMPKQLPKGPY